MHGWHQATPATAGVRGCAWQHFSINKVVRQLPRGVLMQNSKLGWHGVNLPPPSVAYGAHTRQQQKAGVGQHTNRWFSCTLTKQHSGCSFAVEAKGQACALPHCAQHTPAWPLALATTAAVAVSVWQHLHMQLVLAGHRVPMFCAAHCSFPQRRCAAPVSCTSALYRMGSLCVHALAADALVCAPLPPACAAQVVTA